MLGEKIAEQRKKLGLSQEELAEKLNISQKSISKYERGNRRPSYEVLTSMASLFGVSADYLLELENGGETVFGEKIVEQRKRKGITQQELADALNISRSTLAGYEAENKKPSYKVLVRIAEYFGVTTDYLLGAEGDAMGTEEKINEITQRVGRNIRSIREQAGLSQDEFAEGFSVKQPTVANWETGKRQPDLNMLIQIAQFGGTSLDDLVMKELTPPVPLYVRNMVYLRKKRGYSQGELATVLGLQGASSIELVESGKCELPVSKLVRLADFFGVTMDQITKQDLSQEVSECRQQ